MEFNQIIKENLKLIIWCLSILGARKIFLIIVLKIIFKKATIKQVENFVKNTKTSIISKNRNLIDET